MFNANEIIENDKLPALFVEGKSDHIIFKAIIEQIDKNHLKKIKLVEPPISGAGAGYVADHLIAWNFTQKHMPMDNRLKAYGVLDNDEAGKTARKNISKLVKKHDLISSIVLPKTEIVIEASKKGVLMQTTLEELYPVGWWEHAVLQGWLKDRDLFDLLSNEIKRKIINGDVSLEQIKHDLGNHIILEKQPNSNHKMKWAKWCAGQIKKNGLHELSELTNIIYESLAYLT